MIYSNINHVKSKIESLKRIIDEEKPVVVALVETKLAEKESITIDGYEPFKMNRNEYGGGVMILVKNKVKNIVVVVEENKEVGEIMWVTISNGRTNIRMGLVYAPQENETKVAELKTMYKSISGQVKKAKEKKQNLLLIGDFNCKIGSVVKKNTEEITRGGNMLLDMVGKHDLKIMNTSKKCQGVWTRTDGSKRSILDYVIVENEDEELVKEMIIDEEREITPNHNQDGRTIYSDHFTIKLEMNWNMRYKAGEHSRTVINEETNAEFELKTTESDLLSIWKTTANSQEKYSKWNKEVTDIAESIYVRKKKKKKELKAVRMLKRRKKEIKSKFSQATPQEKAIYVKRRKLINEHIENHQREENKQRTISVANKIKREKGFDGGAFWEFNKRSKGKKKEAATAMKNERGEITENPEEIINIYKNFYEKLLAGREMKTESGKQIENMVNKYVDQLVRQADKKRIQPFTEDEYEEMKKSLKSGKAPDLQGWRYEMVKHAGKDLDKSMLEMINELATNNMTVEEWEEMVIKSIGKGKGDQQSMDSKRGLFLTNIVSKVMEKLIKNRTKNDVEEGMTPFQCGGVKRRGIGDNLLIFNSVIEEFRADNKDLFVLFTDLEKCFDQLWLKDCIKEIVQAGMPIAEAVYIYKMNSKVRVRVETPVGRTEAFELTEIVRQGTVCAVDLCGVSTDKINKLRAWGPPLIVSGIEVKHPVYVDDMLGLGTAEMIEEIEPKMRFLEETKKYVFNNEKGKTEIMEMELSRRKSMGKDKPSISVNKGQIGYTEKYKCLGDMYDKTGKNMSKAEKKMEKVNFIAAEVKRKGSYSMVGKADTSVRVLLLEQVVKPTLLFNTETWVNVTKNELKALDKGHYQVLRKVFEQKEHTPYFGILMEIGCWPYSFVVVYKRLMYFHHLMHSDGKRITRRIVVNQMDGKGKGKSWYNHGVKEWLVKLEMPYTEDEVMNIKKSAWKKEVKEKINKMVGDEMEQQKEKMTKLRFTGRFEQQEYVGKYRMEKVKKIMQMRLNMTDLKANFRGKYDDRKCPACRIEDETTEHVIACKEYQQITGHTLKTTTAEELQEEMNNLEWMEKACEVYSQIEEVRKWLI